jgi:hypothetical protein
MCRCLLFRAVGTYFSSKIPSFATAGVFGAVLNLVVTRTRAGSLGRTNETPTRPCRADISMRKQPSPNHPSALGMPACRVVVGTVRFWNALEQSRTNQCALRRCASSAEFSASTSALYVPRRRAKTLSRTTPSHDDPQPGRPHSSKENANRKRALANQLDHDENSSYHSLAPAPERGNRPPHIISKEFLTSC